MTEAPFTVAVVGGGLVGSLAAVYFAERGWKVNLYESREDIRTVKQASGRSINLALSHRGISALEHAGAAGRIVDTLIPMRGRMIHTTDGKLSSQPYGIFGECINSVDRKLVNERLLDSLGAYPNVTVFFRHELTAVDFAKRQMSFTGPKGEVRVAADLLVGCDGVYSKMRRDMMRVVRMNFSQEYIEHGYVELNMPPNEKGEYKMNPNHLHIWPRHTFMMIALPNVDRSFTVTLFMPWAKFDAITTKEDLMAFFTSTFPDAVDLIGQELLITDYFANPKGPLVSVKCNPYNFGGTGLILGDAAHAMVPFYGQGMNCGFEDCLVLDEILDKHIGKKDRPSSRNPSAAAVASALDEYTRVRHPDASAMCDLAMYNYVEMRSSVVRFSYLLRKRVEAFLHKIIPKSVIPLYTMVSFSRMRYSEAMARFKTQTAVYNLGATAIQYAGVACALGVGVLGLLRFSNVKYVTLSVASCRLFFLK